MGAFRRFSALVTMVALYVQVLGTLYPHRVVGVEDYVGKSENAESS